MQKLCKSPLKRFITLTLIANCKVSVCVFFIIYCCLPPCVRMCVFLRGWVHVCLCVCALSYVYVCFVRHPDCCCLAASIFKTIKTAQATAALNDIRKAKGQTHPHNQPAI